MSDEFLIKVNVAGRLYPLNIKKNKEEIIRKAAKTINEKVLQYQQKMQPSSEGQVHKFEVMPLWGR